MLHLKAGYVLIAAGVVLTICACRGAHDDNMLQQAWDFCTASEYKAAYPLARAYTLRYPENAVAHFILGKCFANRTPMELTRAKGEFETAAFLFSRSQTLYPLNGAYTATDFQSAVHFEIALTLMYTALEAQKAGIAEWASLGVIKTALEHVGQGLQFTPESTPLQELRQKLESVINRIEGRPQPSAPPPGNYVI